MKISLTILLSFLLNLSIAQEIMKLNYNECGQLSRLIQKHKSLGGNILTKESIGSLSKRISLSKIQYKKAIELLDKSVLNECNQRWNKHTDQFQIVDCYIQMEEFDEAKKALNKLENEFRYDVYPHGPYGEQFFDYYFKIHKRHSYHSEIRRNGIIYHCGNSFDYMLEPKYQLEQSIERSKILREKKEWKYLVLFLQQVPISLNNRDSELETHYKILNQFLIEGMLNIYQPEKLLLELQKSEIQEADINNFGYFSFYFEPCTHFITVDDMKFGLHINEKIDLGNRDVIDKVIKSLWLTKGVKVAIYNK